MRHPFNHKNGEIPKSSEAKRDELRLVGMPLPNLKTLAKQKRYRLAWDESRQGKEQDPTLMVLPAKFGHIYVHGVDTLGAACDSTRIAAKLLRLPYTYCHQRGDDGANVLFPVEHLAEVAGILRVRKRKKCTLTESQRVAAGERLRNGRRSPLVESAKAAPDASGGTQ
jgi:hypothetical protein